MPDMQLSRDETRDLGAYIAESRSVTPQRVDHQRSWGQSASYPLLFSSFAEPFGVFFRGPPIQPEIGERSKNTLGLSCINCAD